CTYEQYIAAYNNLTTLMSQGKGDTPEAQAAYAEFVKVKACYNSGSSGTGQTTTSGQTVTGGGTECPQDTAAAYQQYIAAYNKLTYLMNNGEGNTPQAQEAYEQYAKAKACYESGNSGTVSPATTTTSTTASTTTSTTTTTTAPMPSPTASAGLVLHLPFDGSYNDASGYGNNGTPKGNMRFANGVVGQQAAYFDGKSYVAIRDSNSLDLSRAFTFSVWLYKEDAGEGGYAVVLSKGDTAATDDNSPYALFHDYSGLSPTVRLTKDNSWTGLISAGATTDFKQWHHLGVTWDGRDVKFYVDGVLKDTQTWQGPLPNSAASLLIGCDPPGLTEYFRGMMDDLRIYNYALSDSEVQAVYSGAGHATPTPTPTPTTTTTTTTAGTALIAESRTVAPGAIIQVPVNFQNAQNVGSLGFKLGYNPSVVQVIKVSKGSLLASSTFTSNVQSDFIIFGFATPQSISGTGSAAVVEFQALGAQGSKSPLTLTEITATGSSGATLSVNSVNGELVIGQKQIGDANGDGKLSVLDALIALKIYVQALPLDLTVDINKDGRVTPEDARLIMEMAKP
ncbi:MAG: cohesin domain-containing protein, partial [Dehalococcoidia bacterium]|nr:cohesin domain-containing protein [Dehalococcoidia bacterium]